MTTPASEAINGLVGALRECGSLKFGDEQICWACQAPTAECTCPPSGRERQARAALAAFESRGRLRDDRALLGMLDQFRRGAFGGPADMAHELDRYLFGPATPPTPEERER